MSLISCLVAVLVVEAQCAGNSSRSESGLKKTLEKKMTNFYRLPLIKLMRLSFTMSTKE